MEPESQNTGKPAVRRPEAYDDLGQAITTLQQALTQLWEAAGMVEALDAGKAPSDATIQAAALTNLTATCQEWQKAMLLARDNFITWMLSVAQEHHEALSGKELLRDLVREEER